MNHSLLKHYAEAFYSLGKEKDKVETYYQDLTFVFDVFKKVPELIKFLSSPMILKEEKDKILEVNFKSHINIACFGFLEVLVKKKVIAYFFEIKNHFDHLYHDYQGILEGRVYTPFPLSEESKEKLQDIFSKKYGKQVVFKELIDKKVIAGMRIYVNDTLYDYSIDSKLNQIRQKLIVKD